MSEFSDKVTEAYNKGIEPYSDAIEHIKKVAAQRKQEKEEYIGKVAQKKTEKDLNAYNDNNIEKNEIEPDER